MPFTEIGTSGLILYEPKVWEDERGYFYESFNEKIFKKAGIDGPFVQDNQALSSYGILRGLHYQVKPFAQAKLVRVIEGEVLDIAVDLREDSPTYGQWFGAHLSGENKLQLYVPRGFAHGYLVLSERALFSYKCDNFYSKEHEAGIIFNDPTLNIDWEIDLKNIVLSEKDKTLPPFGKHKKY
jgi:dTDP-4-dehydrorhamnose 3,5-epimerase